MQLQSPGKFFYLLEKDEVETHVQKWTTAITLKKIPPTTLLNDIFTEWPNVNTSKQHWSNFWERTTFLTAQKVSACIQMLIHTTCFFIYLDLHNQKLCTMQILFLSCQREFQTQSLWRQIICLGHWEYVCCIFVKTKKEGNPCLQILRSGRQTEKRFFFSQRQSGYRSSGQCPTIQDDTLLQTHPYIMWLLAWKQLA